MNKCYVSNPAISIIIPVYNEERFLRTCLESIENQTMKDFEVIIVNDGSIDDSLSIMREFEKRNSNFRIIDQENSGTGRARNQALLQATGNYIAFVDSDDYVEPEFLEKLYLSANETGADIVCCGYCTYIPEKNKKKRKPFLFRTGVYQSDKMLNSLIKDVRMHFYMWNKLWKKDLFEQNNINFPNMCFEDIPVCVSLFYNANKVSVINHEFYNYTKHEDSIVSNIDIPKLNDYIRSLAYIRNFLEKKSDYDPYKISFIWYCCRTIITNCKLVYKVCRENKDYKGLFNKVKSLNSSILYCMSKRFKCFNDVFDFPDSID